MAEWEPLSAGDDERIWSDREVRGLVERAWEAGREAGRVDEWRRGWNDALVTVGVDMKRRGGLGDGRANDDLRRLVGERFASGLEGVWVASLRYLSGSVPGDGGVGDGRMGSGVVRRATGLTDRRLVMGSGTAGGWGKKGVASATGGVIRDEAALAFKAQVDRKIRKIAREMENWLENRSFSREENVVKRCRKCKRFADESWNWCPFDGEKME